MHKNGGFHEQSTDIWQVSGDGIKIAWGVVMDSPGGRMSPTVMSARVVSERPYLMLDVFIYGIIYAHCKLGKAQRSGVLVKGDDTALLDEKLQSLILGLIKPDMVQASRIVDYGMLQMYSKPRLFWWMLAAWQVPRCRTILESLGVYPQMDPQLMSSISMTMIGFHDNWVQWSADSARLLDIVDHPTTPRIFYDKGWNFSENGGRLHTVGLRIHPLDWDRHEKERIIHEFGIPQKI